MSETTGKKPDRGDAKHENAARGGARPSGDKANAENAPAEKDRRLDEGLEETFPSSDPVSVKITK